MIYCLNPNCNNPQNPDSIEYCQVCGTILRLQNRYYAIRPIGQGGFGRTFLAIDESQVGKPRCVIKQFYPQQQGTDNLAKASELFRQEAQRLKELGDHPQIPALWDYLEQDGYQYLIQEFIDGYTLEQDLADNGVFSEQKIRQLLQELLPIIQFIHDRQIIHRDIKPANVIRRTSDRHLFLVDLGAAKQATGTALAKTGTVIGSAEFTAPEQSRGKASFASDLYSLGVTCIHLLTGMSPFDLFDSGSGNWVWQDYLRQSITPSLQRILEEMVYPATNLRYKSATEVLRDLAHQHREATHHSLQQETAQKKAKFSGVESLPLQPTFREPERMWEGDYEPAGELSPYSPGGEGLQIQRRSLRDAPISTKEWVTAIGLILIVFYIVPLIFSQLPDDLTFPKSKPIQLPPVSTPVYKAPVL